MNIWRPQFEGANLQTLELLSGTQSFSAVARGHRLRTFTVDLDSNGRPDLCADLRSIRATDLSAQPTILWASPPCEASSVASTGRNWNRDRTPKSARARLGIQLVAHSLSLIRQIGPVWWFLENPRGMLRTLPIMHDLTRHTITYCQYGDIRMKPPDIWTNAFWWMPRPCCRCGDTCHQRAPRGSKTGTQGMKDARELGKIPPALFHEIFDQLRQFEATA